MFALVGQQLNYKFRLKVKQSQGTCFHFCNISIIKLSYLYKNCKWVGLIWNRLTPSVLTQNHYQLDPHVLNVIKFLKVTPWTFKEKRNTYDAISSKIRYNRKQKLFFPGKSWGEWNHVHVVGEGKAAELRDRKRKKKREHREELLPEGVVTEEFPWSSTGPAGSQLPFYWNRTQRAVNET